jgi:hypothetical protein
VTHGRAAYGPSSISRLENVARSERISSDAVELGVDGLGGGWGEDRAHGGGDHLGVGLDDLVEHAAAEQTRQRCQTVRSSTVCSKNEWSAR